MIEINELKLNDNNPRFIRDERFQKLKDSIEQFPKMMKLRPIVVDKQNIVLGGNMRLRALIDLGYKSIPGEWVKKADELNEEEKRRFIIADNTGFGEWDYELLASEWDSVELETWGMELPDEWGAEEPEAQEDGYEVPDEIETDVKEGDLIEIGPHRLFCGDSTKAEDVGRLMDGEKADLCFSSPPYNLGVSAKLSGNTEIGKKGNVYESYNDNSDEKEWLLLMNYYTSNALNYSEYNFVNVQSLAGNRTALWEWIYNNKDFFVDVAIWDKGHAAPAAAQRVLNSVFEFVFIFTKDNPNRAIRISNDFRGTVDNVFRLPPQRKNEFASIHGATFPIELPSHIISTFCKSGVIVLDLFLGSGTTMVAAHQLNRICYGMEIDPKYCQVIIDRMHKLDPDLEIKINGEKYEPKVKEVA